jgi:hypothetical protein
MRKDLDTDKKEVGTARALESTSEYLEWFKAQTGPVQEAVRAYVKLLLEKGPSLGQPY